MKYVAILLTVLLVGCQTAPTVPTQVLVPTPVACIKPDQVPPAPTFESLSDTDVTADGTVMLHLARDFAKAKTYADQLNVLIDACRK